MKQSNPVLCVVMMLAGLTAFAGNEGPHGIQGKQSPIIAEITTGGGLRPPTAPTASGLRLFADGSLLQFVQYSEASKNVYRPVAKLSPELIASIVARFDAVTPGKLEQESPGQPGCMDAPSTTYRVFLENGDGIELAARIACKNSTLNTPGAAAARGALELLEELANLQN